MAIKLVSGAIATLPRSTTGPIAVVFTKSDPVLIYDNEDRLRFQVEIMANKPANLLVQASGEFRRAMMSSPLLAADGRTEVLVLAARQVTLIGPSDDIDIYHIGKTTALRHLASAYGESRSESDDSVRIGAQLNEIAIAVAHHIWPGSTTADGRGARAKQGIAETANRMQELAKQLRSSPDAIDASDLLGLAAFRTLIQATSKDGSLPAQFALSGTLDMTSLRKAGAEIRGLLKTDLGDVPIALEASQLAAVQTRATDKLTMQCEPGAHGRVRVSSVA
ncbi:hypothetical protein [Roseiterribacter gracilis]|uniref:Uncharacterized protein n=1 Tax=Roseiterribacter gracilis TaxID=2812848 RepID=A0A8S8XI02_9PROT|nr:hypothetical protein TMPK1_31430 [Rhodospirillales bacterium TMPK1]